MCVCIWKPAGKQVKKDILEKCWETNSEGAGYMWADGKQVHIRKGFFTFQRFWKAYKHDAPRLDAEGRGVAIHFRISTSGKLDQQNCHPHRVSQDLAFIHNGVMALEIPKESPVSDSVVFCQMLKSLPLDWYRDNNLRVLVEMAVGRSKLVFLNAAGEHFILGEGLGEWEDGVWFSNTHWKPFTSSIVKGSSLTGWWEWSPKTGGRKFPGEEHSAFSEYEKGSIHAGSSDASQMTDAEREEAREALKDDPDFALDEDVTVSASAATGNADEDEDKGPDTEDVRAEESLAQLEADQAEEDENAEGTPEEVHEKIERVLRAQKRGAAHA